MHNLTEHPQVQQPLPIGNCNLATDQQAFEKVLKQETALLKKWHDEKRFSEAGFQSGYEIEFWLVDSNGMPVNQNLQFMQKLKHLPVTTELHASGLEINSPHQDLTQNALSESQKTLEKLWKNCCDIADAENKQLLLSGSLMTGKEQNVTSENITDNQRYHLIEKNLSKLRNFQNYSVNIHGHENINLKSDSLCANGLTGSFQIRLKVPASQFKRFYNASMIVSAPLVAIAYNSPFMLGKRAWAETRIPFFEQVMNNIVPKSEALESATFGSGYLTTTWYDLFLENYYNYPHLIPTVDLFAQNPLHHVAQQNSVIYRWTRPVIGYDEDGTPHLRLEFRPLPSGPTITDMVANSAFYYGLMMAYATDYTPPESQMSFAFTRSNFYQAAKNGDKAVLMWLDGKTWSVMDLITQELIPKAKSGLAQLGISKKDSDYYLDIIQQRAQFKATAGAWQVNMTQQENGNLQNMLQHYIAQQNSNQPVHTWPTI